MNKTNVSEEVNTIKWLLSKTHEDALVKNEEQTTRWKLYKDDHESLSSRLMSFRDQLTHPIMVPIGTKALMKGVLVHTNEILVSLGDNWFAKQSAKEAAELCQRRIRGSEEMLVKLNKERELLESRMSFPIENDTFGNLETQEIIEPYEEESEKEWRARHRQKEREYHQKLADLRKQQKTHLETEEDLWKRLDALDLQEELEDELNRLNDGCEDELDSSEADSQSQESESNEEEDSNEETQRGEDVTKQYRRISFDKELDVSDSDDEPVRIFFQHSHDSQEAHTCEDLTPSSIYTKYSECFNRVPKSILKKTESFNLEKREVQDNNETFLRKTKSLTFEEKATTNTIEEKAITLENHRVNDPELTTPALGDVVETCQSITQVQTNTRPVSKFKASRQAVKTNIKKL